MLKVLCFIFLFTIISVGSLYGHSNSDNDLVKVLSEKVDCLRKKPRDVECRKWYVELKRQYTRPRCPGKNVRGIFSISDGTELIEKDRMTEVMLDQDPMDGRTLLNVSLDDKGTALLARMTERSIGKTLITQIGQKKSNSWIGSKIIDGHFNIIFGIHDIPDATTTFNQLCPKPIIPKLDNAWIVD